MRERNGPKEGEGKSVMISAQDKLLSVPVIGLDGQ